MAVSLHLLSTSTLKRWVVWPLRTKCFILREGIAVTRGNKRLCGLQTSPDVLDKKTICWLFLESNHGSSVFVQFIQLLCHVLIILKKENSYWKSSGFWHHIFGGMYCLRLDGMKIDVSLPPVKHSSVKLIYLVDLCFLREGVRTHTAHIRTHTHTRTYAHA